jgi:hypothetical protein
MYESVMIWYFHIIFITYILFLDLYLRIGSINFYNTSMYVFFVMHHPEDGHMSGRNM